MKLIDRLLGRHRDPAPALLVRPAIPPEDLRAVLARHEAEDAKARMWRFVEQQGRGGRGAPRDAKGRFVRGGWPNG
jgi:hypothetical protein